jgi:hypothetical protein
MRLTNLNFARKGVVHKAICLKFRHTLWIRVINRRAPQTNNWVPWTNIYTPYELVSITVRATQHRYYQYALPSNMRGYLHTSHHVPRTASLKKTIRRIALTGHEVEAYKHMSISLRPADMLFRILFTILFPLIYNTKQSATICPEAFVHHYR